MDSGARNDHHQAPRQPQHTDHNVSRTEDTTLGGRNHRSFHGRGNRQEPRRGYPTTTEEEPYDRRHHRGD